MISVCMATYNGERFIKQQIDSILSQLADNDELIISDDASTDATLEIIAAYDDPRIKVLHHEKDLSLCELPSASFRLAAQNFENALKVASGDYLFLSDQDDIWIDQRVEKTIELLKNCDLVMCNLQIINANNDVTNKKFHKTNPIHRSLIYNVYNSNFLGCCMAFRREVLHYCLPFPEKLIGHDYWIGNLVCVKGKSCFTSQPYHNYRRYDENVSTATSKSNNTLIYKFTYRFVFLVQILKRLYWGV